MQDLNGGASGCLGMADVIRVAIVDDHPLYREGIASALRAWTEFAVVGQGADAADAVRIARQLEPDIILLDKSMPGDGLAAARDIAATNLGIKCILLTVSEDERHVKSAMEAGAAGYIVKGVTGSELASALRAVHAGARYVSPALAARIIAQKAMNTTEQPSNTLSQLTNREFEITGHVARGLTNKEVARALALSEKTVKHHMTRIMHKLQVRNRMEVVLLASTRAGRKDQPLG